MTTRDAAQSILPSVTAPVPNSPWNLIGGDWAEGRGAISRTIRNPADASEVIREVREAAEEQVEAACTAAADAFVGWRATPAPERARVLFRFRELLEANYLDLSRGIVRENGKLLSEAKGSLRRGIDVVEFACGIASHLLGQVLPKRPARRGLSRGARAVGRGGRHSPVQLSGHDSAVDDADRSGLRQHVHS